MALSPTAVSAFWFELEKIAVDVSDLGSKVLKAKNVFFNAPTDPMLRTFLGGAPAFAVPTAKVQRVVAKSFTPEQIQRAQGIGERAKNLGQTNYKPDPSLAGHIYVDPAATARAFNLKPAQVGPRNALSSMTAAHELFERRVKPRDMLPMGAYYSHLSPDVLMKEHNLLQRATGRGAKSAVAALRQMRKQTGEFQNLKDLLERTHGPRTAQFFQEGEKLPKALRKSVLRKIRQDPSVILGQRSPGDFMDARLATMERQLADAERLSNPRMGSSVKPSRTVETELSAAQARELKSLASKFGVNPAKARIVRGVFSDPG